MILIGNVAKKLRESRGITQRELAHDLQITVVHLSNIENNKSAPSPALLERYSTLWNVDLYVLAWCLQGDVNALPAGIRKSARELTKAWTKQLGITEERRMETDSSCSKYAK